MTRFFPVTSAPDNVYDLVAVLVVVFAAAVFFAGAFLTVLFLAAFLAAGAFFAFAALSAERVFFVIAIVRNDRFRDTKENFTIDNVFLIASTYI